MLTTTQSYLARLHKCFREIVRRIEKIIASKLYFVKYNYCFAADSQAVDYNQTLTSTK